MRIILSYVTAGILLVGLGGAFLINSRYQERLALQGNAVRQILLAALAYPSGKVMEWPTDIPFLVKWSDGELNGSITLLDMANLAYPRPDDRGYAIQPALVYRTGNLFGDRYIVGYCDGNTKVVRDPRIYAAARKLESALLHNTVVSLNDWQKHIPEMVRR